MRSNIFPIALLSAFGAGATAELVVQNINWSPLNATAANCLVPPEQLAVAVYPVGVCTTVWPDAILGQFQQILTRLNGTAGQYSVVEYTGTNCSGGLEEGSIVQTIVADNVCRKLNFGPPAANDSAILAAPGSYTADRVNQNLIAEPQRSLSITLYTVPVVNLTTPLDWCAGANGTRVQKFNVPFGKCFSLDPNSTALAVPGIRKYGMAYLRVEGKTTYLLTRWYANSNCTVAHSLNFEQSAMNVCLPWGAGIDTTYIAKVENYTSTSTAASTTAASHTTTASSTTTTTASGTTTPGPSSTSDASLTGTDPGNAASEQGPLRLTAFAVAVLGMVAVLI